MTTRISVPTFLGGISQQTHGQRQPNLVDDALNVEFLATEGATKRYPTEHVAMLDASDLAGSRVLTLERDDAEYAVLISDTGVRVFDLDGTEATVTATGGFGYLAGGSETDFRWQTVADSVFVLNRAMTVAGDVGTEGPSWANTGEATLFVRSGNYGNKYTVTIKTAAMAAAEIIEYTVPAEPGAQADIGFGVAGSYDTGAGNVTAGQADGSLPFTVGFNFQSPGSCEFQKNGGAAILPASDFRGDPREKEFYYEGTNLSAGDRLEIRPYAHNFSWFIQTSEILKSLKKRLESQVPTLFTETVNDGSVMRINVASEIEEFTVTDSQAGDGLVGWRSEIDKFSDLPLVAKHGQVVEVVGLTTDTADNYFVRFASAEWAEETDRDFDLFDTFSGFGPGTWIETTEPDAATGTFDASTMPHILRRTGLTTFVWEPVEWTPRDAGDEESNPTPSFVGNAIRDIFWHQNRLGFLAQNSVSMSESAQQYNFWRTTVLSLPDSDPIDFDAADLDGDVLNHAAAFNDRLIIFSREGQAAVFGTPFLSPSTVQAPVISKYRAFANVDPVLAGQSLFFGYSSGQFAQFREYIPTQQQDQFIDAVITTAAPKLIPSNVRKLSKASVDQQLAVLTEDDRSALYLYQYYRQGQDLLQASWTRWSFGGDIVDIGFIQDRMVLVIERDGETFLETMQLGVGRTEEGDETISRLDRRTLIVSGTYDRGTDRTAYVLPYTFDDDTDMRMSAGTGTVFTRGAEFLPVDTAGASGIIYLSGDTTGQPMYAGESYNSYLELSRPYVKQEGNRGQTQILGASQTVRNLHVALSNTAYLRAEVEYVGSPGASEEFLTDRLDVANLTPGLTREGELRVSIHANVEEFLVRLINDTSAPSTITSGAWDIRLNTRYRLG